MRGYAEKTRRYLGLGLVILAGLYGCSKNPSEPSVSTPTPIPMPTATPTAVPTPPVVLASSGKVIAMLASGADLVFRNSNGVYRVAKTGGTAVPLATGLDYYEPGLDADDQYVYYNTHDCRIYRVALAGGGPELVADIKTLDPVNYFGAGDLVVDGTYIYAAIGGTYAGIFRIPKSGGTPVKIEELNNVENSGICQDDGFLYMGFADIWRKGKLANENNEDMTHLVDGLYIQYGICLNGDSIYFVDSRPSGKIVYRLTRSGATLNSILALSYGRDGNEINQNSICSDGHHTFVGTFKGVRKYDPATGGWTTVPLTSKYNACIPTADSQYVFFYSDYEKCIRRADK